MRKTIVIAWALVALTAAPARAQNAVADFYRGKSIDVYAGLSVGGVYDIFARLLSRYMGPHIPGNPTLVPRNMEGAAGLRLANWIYQIAPKDGTAFGTFARGIAFDPLMGKQGSLFDATKYNWIGSTNDEVSVCASWTASGITTFDQVFHQELVLGTTGGSGDDEQFPRIINGVLGTKFRTVSGYPGGNEVKMAMQRGEVAGRCGWSWSSVKATEGAWLKDKTITVFIQLSFRRHPDLANVPSIMDYVKTDADRQLFRVVFARQVMGWPFAAPPGVPPERVAALRQAFDDTMKDLGFLAEAQKMSLEVTPVSGQKIQELVADLYRTTGADVTARIADILK